MAELLRNGGHEEQRRKPEQDGCTAGYGCVSGNSGNSPEATKDGSSWGWEWPVIMRQPVKEPTSRKAYWSNAANAGVQSNWALTKERLINWGFYDIATAYQSTARQLLKPP